MCHCNECTAWPIMAIKPTEQWYTARENSTEGHGQTGWRKADPLRC